MELLQPVQEFGGPAVEQRGFGEEAVERQNLFDGFAVPRFKVNAVFAPEIPDAGQSGDAGSGEGEGASGFLQHLFQFFVHDDNSVLVGYRS